MPFLFFLSSLVYVGFILKKRYIDKNQLYRKPIFKWIGYIYVGSSFLYLGIAAQVHNEEYNNRILGEQRVMMEQKVANSVECASRLNSHLPSLSIRTVVRSFENYNDGLISAVVYNDYLHLHKHEKKQVQQLMDSFLNSFCGDRKRPIIIRDQLGNAI